MRSLLLATAVCTATLTAPPLQAEESLPSAPGTRSEDTAAPRRDVAPAVEGGSCICTMEYDPVCGRIGQAEMTFSNPCRARCAGAAIVRRGPC